MAPPAAATGRRALDVAERLVQTRGFNGFSYADIAEALGVTKASLHYHFPSKADLGQRLIERYEGLQDKKYLSAQTAAQTKPGSAPKKASSSASARTRSPRLR